MIALVVALAVVAAGHALLRTATYGAAVGHDEVAFLSAAENLAAGFGLTMFNGKPLTNWPPFYPMTIAVPAWFGVAPADAGRWLNALAFGALVCGVGLWLRGVVRSPALIMGASAIVAVAPELNAWAASLRGAALFAALTFGGLGLLANFLRRPAPGTPPSAWWPLLAAAVLAALAAVTRYAGAALIAAGVLLLLLRPGGWRERLAPAMVFAAIAATPVALVAVRVDAGGRLGAEVVGLGYLLGHVRDIFLFWGLPAGTPGWPHWLYLGGVGLAGTALAGVRWWRGRSSAEAHRHGSRVPIGLVRPIGVFATFVVVYVAFHCWAAWAGPAGSSYWEMKRFLAAVYAPVVCLGALLAERLLGAGAGRPMLLCRWVGTGFALAALLHVAIALRANVRTTAAALAAGYTATSYNAAYWDDSPTLNYLRAHPPPGPIFSTDHALLWWRSGLPASAGRHRWLRRSLDGLVRKLEGKPHAAYFVWVRTFHGANAPYTRFIHLMPGFEPVARLSDGGVYRVSAGWRFDGDEWRRRVERQRSGPS